MIPARVFTHMTRKVLRGAPTKVNSIYPVVSQFHCGRRCDAYERTKKIGNPHKLPYLVGKESVPTWKMHWLYMMKWKAEIEGEEEKRPRSDQLNWNYSSELRAFAHRLKIQVHSDEIRTVFTEPSDSSGEETPCAANEELFNAGYDFTVAYLRLYISRAFPKLGADCAASVLEYLVSEELLAYLAENLGYRDLIQSSQFPVAPISLFRCFLASVAAVASGPGGKVEAAKFVNDFVVTNLVDKDIIHDIWKPKDPMKILVKELTALNLPPPEVRLTKRAGITTVTPVVFVGLFCDRRLLSESAGESVIKAETDAAKIALKNLYDVGSDGFVLPLDMISSPAFTEEVERIRIELPPPSAQLAEKDKAENVL